MKQKSNIVIICAVVIVLVGAIAYFIKMNEASQSMATASKVVQQATAQLTDEKASWQTYSNAKLGFELKYPSDWKLSENSGNNYDLSVVSLASKETQKLSQDRQIPFSEDISVYYYPSIAEEPENIANNLGATTLDELISRDVLITKIGSTEIGGIQATDVIWGGEGAYYAILIVKDSHLYKIWFNGIDNKDKLTAVENSIISSFKFTR